ncbi:MAG: UDP-N-acetylglucosamine 1-carboxyvinyltransferase [Butyrivibrio sp.]|nr:UDP-N-acetylglucosamine 1-carboxyvinyltransferase [Butyrivibrio sp.]
MGFGFASELEVRGGRRLEGTLVLQGSKNSALPIMAASLLLDGMSVLENCPDILDVREMLAIINGVGGCQGEESCGFTNEGLVLFHNKVDGVPDYESCMRFRASSILMGALLATAGFFAMPYPGGCKIGRRPLDYHIDGLRALGASVEEKDGMLVGCAGRLKGGFYRFPYPSVGALENLLLAAVKAEGESVFENCAREPEIADLCDFLIKAGADIDGAGTDTIRVRGVGRLCGIRFKIPGDRIVAGTYMTACAVAGGNIRLCNIEAKRLECVTDLLKKTGCHIFTDGNINEIIILSDGRRRALNYVETGPYPGFSTDMQPQITALSAFSAGSCRIRDRVFEARYSTARELEKLGAKVAADGDSIIITGGESLHGGIVGASDLRCGAALVIAALGIHGKTVITDCAYIMRGYEDIQRDLEQLGADILWRTKKEGDAGGR